MSSTTKQLFANIHQSDPLRFWANQGLNYSRVTAFLDFDTNELSKLGGISKNSVRLDSRIPRDLKDRLIVGDQHLGDVSEVLAPRPH